MNLQQPPQAESSYERWGAMCATAMSDALFYPARGNLPGQSPRVLRITNPPPSHSLLSKVDNQDQLFSLAFQILEEGVAHRAFPGVSIAVTHLGKLVALKALGKFTYDFDSPAVTTETVFDLASVSKVVATTTVAMLLFDHGLLDLGHRLHPARPGSRKNRRTNTGSLLPARNIRAARHDTHYLQPSGFLEIANPPDG